MYMATSLPSFSSLTRPSYEPRRVQKYPQVKSESLPDEGKSANIVDANLSVLRERIREARKKERLNNCCCLLDQNGWNYKGGYDSKYKSGAMLSESIALVGSVTSALVFVFLSGSFCIFLVSFVVHLYKNL